MSILAPLAAMIIQIAISRSREYLADATPEPGLPATPTALQTPLKN